MAVTILDEIDECIELWFTLCDSCTLIPTSVVVKLWRYPENNLTVWKLQSWEANARKSYRSTFCFCWWEKEKWQDVTFNLKVCKKKKVLKKKCVYVFACPMMQCVLAPALSAPATSNLDECLIGEYISEDGVCCGKCHPGKELLAIWSTSHTSTHRNMLYTAPLHCMKQKHAIYCSTTLHETEMLNNDIAINGEGTQWQGLSVAVHWTWLCFPGFRLVKDCPERDKTTSCKQCRNGTFMDKSNTARNCIRCRDCRGIYHHSDLSPITFTAGGSDWEIPFFVFPLQGESDGWAVRE